MQFSIAHIATFSSLLTLALGGVVAPQAEKVIVVFKKEVTSDGVASHLTKIRMFHSANAQRLAKRGLPVPRGIRRNFDLKKPGKNGFVGYSGEFDKATLAEIKKSAKVDYVEKDHSAATQAIISQNPSTWGCDRISNTKYSNTAYRYSYDNAAADPNVWVYVIDTGIMTSHTEFQGRAVWGTNTVGDNDNNDKAGHGTHVAGIIGSKTFGVAKNVKLIAVKALGNDGRGANSQIIAAIQWAVNNATTGANKGKVKGVINLSLGSVYQKAMNSAAAAAVSAGLVVVTAAGNSNTVSDQVSPASEPTVITVGAINQTDFRAPFSNYGAALDIWAPGVKIQSTWITSNTATGSMDGTSMASPHVAGLAAYYFSTGLKTNTDVTKKILTGAITANIKDAKPNSPSKVAYNFAMGVPPAMAAAVGVVGSVVGGVVGGVVNTVKKVT